MIDHAEIVLGDWAIHGTAPQAVRFLDAIPEITVVTRDGIELPFFNTTNRSPDGRWVEVDISGGSRGNVTYQTRPIIGGTLNRASGAGRVPRSTAGEHVRLGLDAHLNINRFLTAQPIKRMSRLDRPPLVGPLATAIATRHAAHGTEYCLTDDTNVIIGNDSLYRYALSKSAEDHFMDCIRHTEFFMTTELQATAGSYDVSVNHMPYYSLRRIEFVWEFSCSSPIRFVESLDVPMRALGPQSRRHRALVRGERLQILQDSLSISVELSAGCHLIVYAKTNERIRFEVRLDRDGIGMILRKNNKGRDGAVSENTDEKGRTARSHDQLRRMIEKLRKAATERLETALSTLDRLGVAPATEVTALHLCAEVGRILQDDALAFTVLEALRMRGSLASPLHSAMRGAADRLIVAQILRRSAPRSPVFIPTNPYVRAVGELRGFGAPAVSASET
jgi:hypothetical protein